MPDQKSLISDLKTPNQIAQTLNQAVDVKTALDTPLEQLVRLMGLEAGWIFIYEPAALYMVLSRKTVRNAAQADRMPADVLRLTNQYIHEDSQADMFLSAFYGVLDTENGRLTYSNAGHNPPLWWRAESGKL